MSYDKPEIMENPFKISNQNILNETNLNGVDRVTASGFTDDDLTAKVEEMISSRLDQMSEILNNIRIQQSAEVRPLSRKDSGIGMEALRPNDSSSVRDYSNHNRYMENGTILSKRDTLEPTVFTKKGSMFDNVIGGYGLTAEEKMDELREMTEVRTISGLNKIFLDERLNFLVHLHKQLYRILKDGNEYPSKDSYRRINEFVRKMKGKDKTPHEDLLYQVIRSTISSAKSRVKSNPFNIPILEPGMDLNENLIYMTFVELNMEYRTVWFNVMKDINVPEFHSSYKNVCFNKLADVRIPKQRGSSILSVASKRR